jgi:hypothetical protein
MFMIRRTILGLLGAAAVVGVLSVSEAAAQQPQPVPGGQMSRTQSAPDWNRFYHYPYVYYPQNFWGNEYYRSADSLYYRYPPEMRIPVYNKRWENFYPDERIYYHGHHFILDVF